YGIDRIEEINIKHEHFKMADDFDAQEYFSTYFGVVHFEDVKVERIVLRADKYHLHYLRTLPLHESQKEIYTCDEYADFELHLRPTYDFCKELLRAGSQIEVLEPQSLRQEMHKMVSELWEMYKDL
ncbi:MAG: WYL domain-containing protein, partial [Prevotella sp.]|nr:WYL domain-containing protein [Prevotella sp.]